MNDKHSFWKTIPGILTGIAAIITAVGGLLIALSQTETWNEKRTEKGAETKTIVENVESATRRPGGASEKEIAKSSQVSTTEAQVDVTVRPNSEKANSGEKPPNVPNQIGNARINLLSAENGGQVLTGTSDQWLRTIDGEERYFAFYESNLGGKTEAVYAFMDERPAKFDTFTILILRAKDGNIKDFELFWGNESPGGSFHSIGKFLTQDMKLFKTPYQEFKFPPVTAKYLKVRLLSTFEYTALVRGREFQLWGSLK